jgi:hypothetical protein
MLGWGAINIGRWQRGFVRSREICANKALVVSLSMLPDSLARLALFPGTRIERLCARARRIVGDGRHGRPLLHELEAVLVNHRLALQPLGLHLELGGDAWGRWMALIVR